MSDLLYLLLSLHAFICMPSVMYNQTLVMRRTWKLFVVDQAWHRIEPDDAFNIHSSPFGCHIRESGPWHQYHWCLECVKHELTGAWINSTRCISKFLHIVASKALAGGTWKFNDSSDQRLQSRSNLDCTLLRLGENLVCRFIYIYISFYVPQESWDLKTGWFGDPRPLLCTSKPLYKRVQWFLGCFFPTLFLLFACVSNVGDCLGKGYFVFPVFHTLSTVAILSNSHLSQKLPHNLKQVKPLIPSLAYCI